MVTFLLDIITPQRNVYSQDVDMLTVPTAKGTVGILAHHAPLFSALTEGELKITVGSKEYFLAVGGGFMEVTGKSVQVLVSRAYHADELNEAEIKRAREKAKEAIAEGVKGQDLAVAQAILRRSFIELKVFRRKRVHTAFNNFPISKS